MESSGTWPTIAHGIWPEFLRNYRESVIEDNTCAGSGGDGIFFDQQLRVPGPQQRPLQ